MAWPKGKKRSPVKDKPESEIIDPTVDVDVSADQGITVVDESAPVKFAEQNCIMYHREYEPMKFMKGDLVGEGWSGPLGILGVYWTMDDQGKWIKIL